MPKKKTNYERKGLVRHIADSIFASKKERSQESKWRPRKTQFARLDLDDEEIETAEIVRALSTESDTGEYQRQIMFEKKKKAFDQVKHKKRDLSTITIKPSSKDKYSSRKTNATRSKKAKVEKPRPAFVRNSHEFGCSDDSIDDALSRHTSSSKHTAASKHSAAFFTVSSDPSEFFSKKPISLTKHNLEYMAAVSAGLARSFSGEDGIENINPRREFHQFTLEEDKESTVIEPVSYSDNDSFIKGMEEIIDDDSQHSLGVTSKGTRIQKRTPPRRGEKANPVDFFDDGFFAPANSEKGFDGFDGVKQVFGDSFEKSNPKSDADFFFAPGQLQSKEQATGRQLNASNRHKNMSFGAFRTGQSKSVRDMNTPAFGDRNPLSPLNGRSRSLQTKTSSSKSKNSNQSRPDPDAEWSNFPNSAFERKPDPNGSTAKDLKTMRPHVTANADATATSGPSSSTKKISKSWGKSFKNTAGSESQRSPNREWGPSSQVENQLSSQGFLPAPGYGKTSSSEKSKINDLYKQFNSIRRDVQENRSIPEEREWGEDEDIDDEIESIDRPHTRMSSFGKPMGIQSFSNVISRSFSSSSSSVSSDKRNSSRGSRSSHRYQNRSLNSNSRSRSYEDNNEASVGQQSVSSAASYSKPLGLPNNAIVASMLFRRHHNIDTKAVEARLKARELEYKVDKKRGDIPHAINTNEDTQSFVSAFTEDTNHIDAWRKPTRDLLEHFARSRGTDFDFKRRLQQQRATATELFEA